MTFVDDVEIVRAYVRGPGRVDYVRMQQVDSTVVEVVFSADVDRHAAALATQVGDRAHVRLVAGSLPGHHRSELAEQHWDDGRRGEVLAAWLDGPVRELSFGCDDDGPYLALGLLPHTQATVDEAAARFAPHRIKTFDGPDAVPV